jgi:hypothetical protein
MLFLGGRKAISETPLATYDIPCHHVFIYVAEAATVDIEPPPSPMAYLDVDSLPMCVRVCVFACVCVRVLWEALLLHMATGSLCMGVMPRRVRADSRCILHRSALFLL